MRSCWELQWVVVSMCNEVLSLFSFAGTCADAAERMTREHLVLVRTTSDQLRQGYISFIK